MFVQSNIKNTCFPICRSVIIWEADTHLPVAQCSLPSPASCLACSPRLDHVAVGTTHSNEIFILTVHRQGEESANGSIAIKVGDAGASDAVSDGTEDSATAMRETRPHDGGVAVCNGKSTGIELLRSKQLLPASALAKRWQPDLHTPGVFSGAACGKINRGAFITLDGRDSAPVGGGTVGSSRASGGHTVAPLKSPMPSNTSPSRLRSR